MHKSNLSMYCWCTLQMATLFSRSWVIVLLSHVLSLLKLLKDRSASHDVTGVTRRSLSIDQGLLFKDQDKDKDLSSKDKDKDQDKDCILVLKESLRTRTRTNITAWTLRQSTSSQLSVMRVTEWITHKTVVVVTVSWQTAQSGLAHTSGSDNRVTWPSSSYDNTWNMTNSRP